MSFDRFSDPGGVTDKMPRVKAGNIKAFMGTHRAPRYFDELDAKHVVDLIFAEPERARIKFIKDGDDWFRVVYLAAVP